MTWLALTDHKNRRLSLRGLGTEKRATPVIADVPDQVLNRGSIVFETQLAEDNKPVSYTHLTLPTTPYV